MSIETRKINDVLQPYTESYITANIFTGEECKGTTHWKICEILCEHLTGKTYEPKYVGLKLFIHKITTPITDHLDAAIGLPYTNQFDLKKKIDVKKYARLLSIEILSAIDICNQDELEYHLQKNKE